MNKGTRSARRYHWFDRVVKTKDARTVNSSIDFVNEPHKAIAAQSTHSNVLNMVAKDSSSTRNTSVDLINEGYKRVKRDLELLRTHSNQMSKMLAIRARDRMTQKSDEYVALQLSRKDFFFHPVKLEDFSSSKYLDKILQKLSDRKPEDYKSLISFQGVGPKTIRALSLVSEVIYGAAPSYEDPARYSFAHGGKDGVPSPVDKDTYDRTIEVMRKAVNRSKIPFSDKKKALDRLV